MEGGLLDQWLPYHATMVMSDLDQAQEPVRSLEIGMVKPQNAKKVIINHKLPSTS